MKSIRIAALVVAAAAVVAFAGVGRPDSAGGAAKPSGGITVNGTGTITSVPDEATFTVGVQTQGSTAREALAANSEQMRRVIEAVRSAGVAKDDVQTQDVSVSANYSEENRIDGYAANNSVLVTIHGISSAGKVLDAASNAGANQVYGPTLSRSDEDDLQAKALREAVGDAQKKARGARGRGGSEPGPGHRDHRGRLGRGRAVLRRRSAPRQVVGRADRAGHAGHPGHGVGHLRDRVVGNGEARCYFQSTLPRLAVALSAAALLVALLGATPLGNAAQKTVKQVVRAGKAEKSGARGPRGKRGPRGPRGLRGFQGPPGDKGDPGSPTDGFEARDTTPTNVTGTAANDATTVLVSAPLPAGKYAFSGQVVLHDTGAATVTCQAHGPGSTGPLLGVPASARVGSGPDAARDATVALAFGAAFAAPGPVYIGCWVDVASTPAPSATANLVAVTVLSLSQSGS